MPHHDAAVQLLEVGAILFALALLSRLGRRFGISAIPLYLLVGLAFGQGGLVPLQASEDFVSFGAELGVILLLLMLGLEYSASELVSSLRAQVPAGGMDMVFNALPGAAIALILGWGPVAAVAMAGVTWVSSSGVIAKMLGDLGRLGNRETPIILSVLVMEDLAMALYLPILTALLAGKSMLGGLGALLIALITVTAVIIIATRFSGAVHAVVNARDPEGLLLGVLGLTLLVAGIAQELQVSAAVGAFLVGIALSGEVAHQATSLLSPLRDLFAAVFFVFFGLSTRPADIPPVLLPALALALVTMATKILTGYLAAKRAGIQSQGRWRAGLALTPRGEFSIVVAGLAVASGIERGIGPLATAYVLITVVLGPLLARFPDLARKRRSPRRSAAAAVALATPSPAVHIDTKPLEATQVPPNPLPTPAPLAAPARSPEAARTHHKSPAEPDDTHLHAEDLGPSPPHSVKDTR